MTPTEAGNILYMHAQTVLRQCEQARRALNCAGQALSGQVTLGLSLGSSAAPNVAANCYNPGAFHIDVVNALSTNPSWSE